VAPVPPATDADVPRYVAQLGLPGLADLHIHFHPERLQAKIWRYFDAAEHNYGLPWPITYRGSEASRIAQLRTLGVRPIPALSLIHI